LPFSTLFFCVCTEVRKYFFELGPHNKAYQKFKFRKYHVWHDFQVTGFGRRFVGGLSIAPKITSANAATPVRNRQTRKVANAKVHIG